MTWFGAAYYFENVSYQNKGILQEFEAMNTKLKELKPALKDLDRKTESLISDTRSKEYKEDRRNRELQRSLKEVSDLLREKSEWERRILRTVNENTETPRENTKYLKELRKKEIEKEYTGRS